MNLEKLLSPLAHFKIVKFFDENPRIIDTPEAVATFTGISTSITKNVLEQLAKAKILTVHRMPSTIGYSYTSDKTMLKKLAGILKKKAKQLSV